MADDVGLTLRRTHRAPGFAAVREIVGKVWPYVLAGIAIGAAIHGYVPEAFMASIMGKDAWWSVPLAVLVGVPMYSNAAGVIPIVQALLAKGAALGTVLAFMMSVIALSLPEMVILRKVLKRAPDRDLRRRGRRRHPARRLRFQRGAVTAGEDDVMKNVKVLGTGCANCRNTIKLLEAVAREKGVEIHVEKVEDIQDIMRYGIMSTPGVVIDGQVVHAGGVPSRQKVEGWLQGAAA